MSEPVVVQDKNQVVEPEIETQDEFVTGFGGGSPVGIALGAPDDGDKPNDNKKTSVQQTVGKIQRIPSSRARQKLVSSIQRKHGNSFAANVVSQISRIPAPETPKQALLDEKAAELNAVQAKQDALKTQTEAAVAGNVANSATGNVDVVTTVLAQQQASDAMPASKMNEINLPAPGVENTNYLDQMADKFKGQGTGGGGAVLDQLQGQISGGAKLSDAGNALGNSLKSGTPTPGNDAISPGLWHPGFWGSLAVSAGGPAANALGAVQDGLTGLHSAATPILPDQKTLSGMQTVMEAGKEAAKPNSTQNTLQEQTAGTPPPPAPPNAAKYEAGKNAVMQQATSAGQAAQTQTAGASGLIESGFAQLGQAVQTKADSIREAGQAKEQWQTQSQANAQQAAAIEAETRSIMGADNAAVSRSFEDSAVTVNPSAQIARTIEGTSGVIMRCDVDKTIKAVQQHAQTLNTGLTQPWKTAAPEVKNAPVTVGANIGKNVAQVGAQFTNSIKMPQVAVPKAPAESTHFPKMQQKAGSAPAPIAKAVPIKASIPKPLDFAAVAAKQERLANPLKNAINVHKGERTLAPAPIIEKITKQAAQPVLGVAQAIQSIQRAPEENNPDDQIQQNADALKNLRESNNPFAPFVSVIQQKAQALESLKSSWEQIQKIKTNALKGPEVDSPEKLMERLYHDWQHRVSSNPPTSSVADFSEYVNQVVEGLQTIHNMREAVAEPNRRATELQNQLSAERKEIKQRIGTLNRERKDATPERRNEIAQEVRELQQREVLLGTQIAESRASVEHIVSYKMASNVAYIEVQIGDAETMRLYAISGPAEGYDDTERVTSSQLTPHPAGRWDPTLTPEQNLAQNGRRYEPTQVPTKPGETRDADQDSEIMMLEHLTPILEQIAAGGEVKNIHIKIVSELAVCPSCEGVIGQFQRYFGNAFPDVQLTVDVVAGPDKTDHDHDHGDNQGGQPVPTTPSPTPDNNSGGAVVPEDTAPQTEQPPVVTGQQPPQITDEQTQHNQQLQNIHQGNYQHYQNQLDALGPYAPAYIQMGMDDTRANLAQMDNRLGTTTPGADANADRLEIGPTDTQQQHVDRLESIYRRRLEHIENSIRQLGDQAPAHMLAERDELIAQGESLAERREAAARADQHPAVDLEKMSPSDREIYEQNQKLLDIYRSNLQILEQQQAVFGRNTPQHIIHQIIEAQSQTQRLTRAQNQIIESVGGAPLAEPMPTSAQIAGGVEGSDATYLQQLETAYRQRLEHVEAAIKRQGANAPTDLLTERADINDALQNVQERRNKLNTPPANNTPNTEPRTEQVASLQERLAIHKRNMQINELQHAQMGRHTPPVVLQQLRESRDEIRKLESEIHQLNGGEGAPADSVLTDLPSFGPAATEAEHLQQLEAVYQQRLAVAAEAGRSQEVADIEAALAQLQERRQNATAQPDTDTLALSPEARERVGQQQNLQEAHQRTLRILELQQAQLGDRTPPHVQQGIAEARQGVQAATNNINQIQQSQPRQDGREQTNNNTTPVTTQPPIDSATTPPVAPVTNQQPTSQPSVQTTPSQQQQSGTTTPPVQSALQTAPVNNANSTGITPSPVTTPAPQQTQTTPAPQQDNTVTTPAPQQNNQQQTQTTQPRQDTDTQTQTPRPETTTPPAPRPTQTQTQSQPDPVQPTERPQSQTQTQTGTQQPGTQQPGTQQVQTNQTQSPANSNANSSPYSRDLYSREGERTYQIGQNNQTQNGQTNPNQNQNPNQNGQTNPNQNGQNNPTRPGGGGPAVSFYRTEGGTEANLNAVEGNYNHNYNGQVGGVNVSNQFNANARIGVGAQTGYEARIGPDGAELSAEARLRAGATVNVNNTTQIGDARNNLNNQLSAEAFGGGEVYAEGNLGITTRGIMAQAELGAFAGVRAEAENQTSLTINGRTIGTVILSGEVSAGIGASASGKFNIDWSRGTVTIGGRLAATLGLGVGGEAEVTLNLKDAALLGLDVANMAYDAMKNDDCGALIINTLAPLVGPIADIGGRIVDGISQLPGALNNLKNAAVAEINQFLDQHPQVRAFVDGAGQVFNSVTNTLGQVGSTIIGGIQQAGAFVADIGGQIWSVIGGPITAAAGQVGQWAGQAWSGITQAAGQVGQWAGQAWSGITQFGGQAMNTIGNAANTVMQFGGQVVEGIGYAVDGVLNLGGEVVNAIGQGVNNVVQFGSQVVSNIGNVVSGVMQFGSQAVSNIGNALNGLRSFGSSVVSSVGQAFGQVRQFGSQLASFASGKVAELGQLGSGVLSFLSGLVEQARSALSGVPEPLRGPLESALNFVQGKLDSGRGIVEGALSSANQFVSRASQANAQAEAQASSNTQQTEAKKQEAEQQGSQAQQETANKATQANQELQQTSQEAQQTSQTAVAESNAAKSEVEAKAQQAQTTATQQKSEVTQTAAEAQTNSNAARQQVETTAQTAQAATQAATQTAQQTATTATGQVQGAWAGVEGFAQGAVATVQQSANQVQGTASQAQASIGESASTVNNIVQDAFVTNNQGWAGVQQKAESLWQTVAPVAQQAANTVNQGIQVVEQGIQTAGQAAGQVVSGIAQNAGQVIGAANDTIHDICASANNTFFGSPQQANANRSARANQVASNAQQQVSGLQTQAQSTADSTIAQANSQFQAAQSLPQAPVAGVGTQVNTAVTGAGQASSQFSQQAQQSQDQTQQGANAQLQGATTQQTGVQQQANTAQQQAKTQETAVQQQGTQAQQQTTTQQQAVVTQHAAAQQAANAALTAVQQALGQAVQITTGEQAKVQSKQASAQSTIAQATSALQQGQATAQNVITQKTTELQTTQATATATAQQKQSELQAQQTTAQNVVTQQTSALQQQQATAQQAASQQMSTLEGEQTGISGEADAKAATINSAR